ncbi:MAG: hypothetical protein J1F03_00785 [Oscillospiraceae bacterium]|nr:hypothetical protein [Oscillospiraceae bacterium]
MAIYKYSSVRYGGGIDISNAVAIPVSTRKKAAAENDDIDIYEQEVSEALTDPEEDQAEPDETPEELLAHKEAELIAALRDVEHKQKELESLKEQYIEQGKEVILEAKRRAEGIIENAEAQADEITKDAEAKRGDVFIKARAEGFEQGKKDGKALLLSEGKGILDEAREFSDRINEEKIKLFEQYEKEIYNTVMAIANKVTLNSMSVKDGTAAKKLIKQAAKDFRNSQVIRITLEENEATTELSGDYEFLKALCGGLAHVEVELLANGVPGTVIVDNGEEITDAGITTQLKMIKELGDGKFREEAPKKRSRKKASEKLGEDDAKEDEEQAVKA